MVSLLCGLKKQTREFPGSQCLRIMPFDTEDVGSIPDIESKIAHVPGQLSHTTTKVPTGSKDWIPHDTMKTLCATAEIGCSQINSLKNNNNKPNSRNKQ